MKKPTLSSLFFIITTLALAITLMIAFAQSGGQEWSALLAAVLAFGAGMVKLSHDLSHLLSQLRQDQLKALIRVTMFALVAVWLWAEFERSGRSHGVLVALTLLMCSLVMVDVAFFPSSSDYLEPEKDDTQ